MDKLVVLVAAATAVLATGLFLLVLIVVIAGLFLVDLLGFPLVWPLVVALIAIACWIPLQFGFGKKVLAGEALSEVKRSEIRKERRLLVYLTLLLTLQAFLILTAAFVVLTAALHEHGLVTEEPPAEADGFVWSLFGLYVWHLFDSIPVLEIPQTLNWEPTTTLTDHLGGALLLTYKLLVIFPLIGIIVGLVGLMRTQSETADRP